MMFADGLDAPTRGENEAFDETIWRSGRTAGIDPELPLPVGREETMSAVNQTLANGSRAQGTKSLRSGPLAREA
ncbi:MAG: hypothetical protein JOY75_23115 [Hyphomicrobiales bacterium]|nr:hypothetical protein [Hyphomicrobiales bacterium]